MGIVRRHTLYGVQRFDGSAPTMLGGIKGQVIETQPEVRNDTSSGEVYPTHLALVAQNVRATFSSTDLATCLALIGITGLALTDDNPLNLYAYAHALGGSRTAGATHRSYTFNSGIVVPRRITADHQGDARIEYEVLPVYDGTNDPVVITDTVTPPTNGTDTARFAIGGAAIEGIAFSHFRSWELDFGLIVDQEGADSDIWPTFVSIQEAMPVFRFRGVDVEWLKAAAIPLTGLSGIHANTKFFLRKRQQGSTNGYVANGTAQHISFTANGLAVVESAFDGTADRNPPAEVSIAMPLKFDGTNAPVVVNTATAIT